MVRGRWWRILLVGAALTLLAACGDDKEPTADGSDASSSPSNATSTTRSTSTTTTSTTTTTAPVGCPGTPGVPPGATNAGDRSADADGDGTADVIRTYRLGDNWHLIAELSSGGTTNDVAVPSIELEPGGLRIIGGTGLTGSDARAELFVVQGAGASAQIVVLYELEGCDLERILAPSGDEAAFPVGGGVLQRGLLSCGGFDEEPVNWLFEQTATRSAEDHWDVHTVGYALTGASPAKLEVTVEQDDVFSDEGMNNRPSFKCGDLSLD